MESKSKIVYPMNEDIVISGIAGRFPESDNMDEFAKNLFSGLDMVTCDDRRWPVDINDGMGSRIGKLKTLDKFDSSFFSMLTYLSHSMDPISRIVLETTYEAFFDAGVCPHNIRGSNTGVYFGINTIAQADGLPQDDFHDVFTKDAAFWVYGNSKVLYANRISFLFDFQGPSLVVDTACSASLVALAQAVSDLRLGACDMAVVATGNLTPAPFSNSIYTSVGLLAKDGKCKVWDKKADGFVRSETIGCLVLQRRSQAKRVYATVLHSKINSDGFKSVGLFSPYWLRQKDLMEQTYREANVDPNDVSYFEAHGTGTNVGDPQEAKAIAEAYCANRKGPLLVGAVKSNIGHSEGSSGLNSVAKVLIAFEHKCIPANLHFYEPKPEINAIVSKKIEPVTKNTPYQNGIAGVNSFGVGGVNAHVLLKSNDKELTPESFKICDPIPRLVNLAGRTEESMEFLFDFIKNNPDKIHRDFFALLNESMKTNWVDSSSNFPLRGYMIIKEKKDGEKKKIKADFGEIEIPSYEYEVKTANCVSDSPVWLVFSGMGSQWLSMASSMMKLEPFRASIERSAAVLKPLGIKLVELLLSNDQNVWKSTVNPFVAITSMQVALYDVIKLLNIKVVGIIGHSFGEVACAYADGCLTLEQAILTSYWRGKIVEDSSLPRGVLAAIGLTWEEAKKRCPAGIVPACHNGSDSVTISGLYEDTKKFVEQLQAENVFARLVAGGEYPYHSPYMQQVAPDLIKSLSKIIREPKKRSSKWISTSYAKSQWDTEAAQYASAEYFTNNLVSPVLFNEGMEEIKSSCITIEVAPHSLFDSIFKRCFAQHSYIGLMKRTEADNLSFFLESLGKLYTMGLNLSIENIYPKIEWPVARSTQSLSSLMKWDHQRSYNVRKYPEYHNFSTASDYNVQISINENDWHFLRDHTVEGKVLFPATGYLYLIWRRLASQQGQPWCKTPVQFENVRFHRPTIVSENNDIKFTIRLLQGSGEFVMYEGGSTNLVCTGKCMLLDAETGLELQDTIKELVDDDTKQRINSEHDYLTTRDIYKELRIRGYDYGPKFQGLFEARSDGQIGQVKWTDHFISFMDSLLHIALVALPLRALFVPIGFDSVRIDPKVLFSEIERLKEEKKEAEQTDFQLKKEFMYFSDKSNEAYHFEKVVAERVEAVKTEGEQLEENFEKTTDLPIQFYQTAFMQLDKTKISLIPVIFNPKTRAIYTHGLEVKGMLPFPIPRKVDQKGLLLEEYQQIAYIEESILPLEPSARDKLIDYIGMCNELSAFLETKLSTKAESRPLKLNPKWTELVIQYYKDVEMKEQNHYKTFMMLKDLLELKLEKLEGGELQVCYSSPVAQEKLNGEGNLNVELLNKFDLANDLVTLTQTSERLVRPLLDTVLENQVDKTNLKIVEVNPSLYLLAPRIINIIKMSYVGNLNFDYTYANSGAQVVSDEVKALNLKTLEWNRSTNAFLHDTTANDLLLYRLTDSTAKTWDLKRKLETFYEAIKVNGFLLVLVRSDLNKVERQIINEFNHSIEDELCQSSLVQKFINTAKNLKFGFVGMKKSEFGYSALLFRKIQPTFEPENFKIIRVKAFDFESWVDPLKEILKSKEEIPPIWLVANENVNGLIGMVNCLRIEPGGGTIRCIYDLDGTMPAEIDFTKSPYKEIGQNDLVFNVFKNNEWGSFRYISLPEKTETIETPYAYLDMQTRGDLTSFKWYESDLKHFNNLLPQDKQKGMIMVDVYCSSLNFKDVMLAMGRIQPGPESAIFDCLFGMEFSGRRQDTGQRVMGMVPFKGFATTITSFEDYLWDIPDEWSLTDAASVPVVYVTAYYSLIVRGNIREGEKVLIHSAAGGVGQAAIRICQSFNCEIFVTVGNAEKREFLKSQFGLPDENIFNSRDVMFEKQIKERTDGRGVDIVLNSLAEDKLMASLRCLGLNGRFLEIGKYDMQMNRQIGMFAFLQNISFHGVCLDAYFREGFESADLKRVMKLLTDLLYDGIKKGVVQPIRQTCYKWHEAEEAFRYMSTGKHIGKVIIKMRDEEKEKVVIAKSLTVVANRRTWFNPSKSYIIVGGLGGFGLELLYWMVMRGAKKFVLSSRSGLKNSYQKLYLKRLNDLGKLISMFNIDLKISTANLITEEGTQELVDEALKKGPVGGIFNLALILSDAYFENQTVETFAEVCLPKLNGLVNLDKVTRKRCTELDYFVCFSSLTAGRGNAGQTNYGFANSGMERICELRRAEGLPGSCIQWGPIGDVGVVAEHMIQDDNKQNQEDLLKLFGGISLQRIASCLEVFDRLLQIGSPVLSSVIKSNLEENKNSSEDDILEQLCAHLNVDKRPRDETIGEAGLDSMTVVEIQQRLERDYDVSLTVADVKRITVGEMKDFRDGKRETLKIFAEDIKKTRMNLANMKFEIPNEPFTIISTSDATLKAKPIFFLPPIEGIYESIRELISEMSKTRPVYCLNWVRKMNDLNSIKKVGEYFRDYMARLEPKGEHEVIGHSFGAIVGIQMCRKSVPIKTLIVLDPMDASNFKEEFDTNEKLEIVLSYLRNFMSEGLVNKLRKEALSVSNEEECVQRIIDVLKSHSGKTINSKDIDDIIKDSFKRAEMILKYQQKNMRKLRMFGRNMSKKVAKKLMAQIGVNVTVLKRVKEESDMEKLNDILLTSYGIRREDFSGRFDVFQVIGNEEEYLTVHLQYISNMVKTKLGIIPATEQ